MDRIGNNAIDTINFIIKDLYEAIGQVDINMPYLLIGLIMDTCTLYAPDI
jgi:hypothetical protein